jgi:hypothetical protein
MKRKVWLVGGILPLLIAAWCAGAADAQSPSLTSCPINYICSLAATASEPLSATVVAGHPQTYFGFLFFDAKGVISGMVEINANGKITSFDVTDGTCTSGDSSKLGELDLIGPAGHKVVVHFVSFFDSGGQNLLLSNAPTRKSTDFSVGSGVCYHSAAG